VEQVREELVVHEVPGAVHHGDAARGRPRRRPWSR
jgi:hypothetical protein